MMCSASVIIIAYNMEQFISRTVKSVLGQTLAPSQIIIIDNGSTDNTSRIINRFANNNSNIIISSLPINVGLAEARNISLNFVKTDYFCFLDADDMLRKDAIEKFSKVAMKYDADLVTCNVLAKKHLFFNNTQHPKEWYSQTGCMSILKCPRQFYEQAAWAKFIKTEYAKKIFYRFTKNSLFCEDVPAATVLFTNTDKICTLPDPLYIYRIRKNSLSSRFEKKQIDDFVFAMTEQDRIMRESRFHSYKLFQSIYEARLLLGNLLLSRLNPKNIDYYFKVMYLAFNHVNHDDLQNLFFKSFQLEVLYTSIMERDSKLYTKLLKQRINAK